MYNRMLIYEPKPKGVIKESTTRISDNNYKKSYNFRIEGYTDSDNNSLGECRNLCGDLCELKYGKDLNNLSSMSTNSLSVGGLFVTLSKKTGVLSVSGTTTKTHSVYGGNYLYITALLRRAISGGYLNEETGGIQIKQFIEGSMSPDYVTENAVESVTYGVATGMRSRYTNGQESAEFAFGYNTNKNYYGKYGNGYLSGFTVCEVVYRIPLFQYTTIAGATTFNDEKVTYTSFKIKPFITINPKGFPNEYKAFSFSGNLTATSLCGNARLKKLEGKTVKFNQLLENDNIYSKEIFNINSISSVAKHIIPFVCSGSTFYLRATGLTNFFWLYDGVKYTSNLLNINVNDNDIIYLCVNDNTIGDSFNLDNNYNSNGIYLIGDLSDLQGKITNTLSLYNCDKITGDLSDLQGKITNFLNLAYCDKITGDLSDLQGKITNYLNLIYCNKITGDYILTSSKEITNIYLYRTAQTPANVDNTLISLAQYATSSNGVGEFNQRTSASDEAVATLKSRGWTIKVEGVTQ